MKLAIGIGTSAILARALGTEGRGDLALILLLPVTLLSIFANGFTSTITYSVATGIWKDEEIMPAITGIAAYLTGIMIVVAGGILPFHDTLFSGISFYLLLATIVYIPLELMTLSLQSLLIGMQEFREKMNLAVVTSPIRLVITLVLLLTFPDNVAVGLLAVILATLVNLVIVYLKCVKLCRQSRLFVRPQFNLTALSGALAYGGVSQLGGVARFLNYKADQFIVFWLLGSGPLGIYAVGVVLAEKLWLFVGNVSGVLFSLTAQHKDSNESGEIAARVAAIVVWFNLAVAIALAAVAIPMVRLIYGVEYNQSGLVILCLLPGITSLGFAKVTGNFIAGIGRPGINAIGSVGGMIINIIANLLLIPQIGLLGAAFATSISYSAIAVYSYICFLKITGLKWYKLFIPRSQDLSAIFAYSTRMLWSR